MAVMPLVSPLTCVGVRRLSRVLSPTWPDAFNPQHFTAPVFSNAHVWSEPAVMAVTPLVSPITCAGTAVSLLVLALWPTWPYPL